MKIREFIKDMKNRDAVLGVVGGVKLKLLQVFSENAMLCRVKKQLTFTWSQFLTALFFFEKEIASLSASLLWLLRAVAERMKGNQILPYS